MLPPEPVHTVGGQVPLLDRVGRVQYFRAAPVHQHQAGDVPASPPLPREPSYKDLTVLLVHGRDLRPDHPGAELADHELQDCSDADERDTEEVQDASRPHGRRL